jgi:hypothetical protein
MNTEQALDIPEHDRLRLRAVVSTIERELSRLSREATPEYRESSRGLMASWAQLVELLALGIAPEVRACPNCHHVCMREATRCGHCWATLIPPPAAVAST